MINNYEIKVINDCEMLFIYLDIDLEFSKINNNTNDIKKIVLDFLKKNKIMFHGSIINIIIGGMLVGNLVLNKPFNTDDISYYKNEIASVDKIMYVPNIKIVEEVLNKNLDIKENNDIKISETSKINNSEIKEDNIKETSNINIITNSNSKANNSNDNVSQEKNNVEDNNIYVTLKRKNGEIEKIELETYIIGVVSAEMPALFHEEALKSQAIIARTYALKKIENNILLTDTESTQSYKSDAELKNMWGSNFNFYYNKIKKCVEETKGMYLTYNGIYIEAVYHSTSNGQTESSINVWNHYYPYSVTVDSIYDNLNPSFIYETFFNYQELSNKLNIDINIDTNFNILEKTESNRINKIEINNIIFNGTDFRQKLGLRSTDFVIEKNENGIKIITKGYGHGVGLSQYGANGYAKNGYNYVDILKHYYKGVTISHK